MGDGAGLARLGWAGREGRGVKLKLNMLTEAQIFPGGPTPQKEASFERGRETGGVV